MSALPMRVASESGPGAGIADAGHPTDTAGFGAPPAPAVPLAAPAGRRTRKADLAVVEETAVDYDLTATLAAEGFEAAPGTFRADRLRWLYETAFGAGTTVLALRAGDRKVGQVALVHQVLTVAGRPERAVALIDLFILKAFRSRAAIGGLYGAVEDLCLRTGIRFILAVPNVKAAGVNTRYLKLADLAPLEIRVGLGGLPHVRNRVESHRVADLDPAAGRALLARYCGAPGDGLAWTEERLWARLQKPGADYALHAGGAVLAISAPRRQGRMAHTMICGLLPRPGATAGRGDVAAVVSAACRLHRRPVFVYTGLNAALPLPGMDLPPRFRP